MMMNMFLLEEENMSCKIDILERDCGDFSIRNSLSSDHNRDHFYYRYDNNYNNDTCLMTLNLSFLVRVPLMGQTEPELIGEGDLSNHFINQY